MSRTSKKRRSEERKAEKRKRKAANRAKYELWKGTDQNKKRKKADGAAGGTKWSQCHSATSCGNPGCKRCFPELHAMIAARAHTRGHLTTRSMVEREAVSN